MTASPREQQVGKEQVGEEQVEHVDPDGEVVEIVSRRRMRAENLRHRSVAIVVTNRNGDLLVHRRADDILRVQPGHGRRIRRRRAQIDRRGRANVVGGRVGFDRDRETR